LIDANVRTRREIESILAAHQQFVQQRPNGQRAQLISRDLNGWDLSTRILAGADLSGTTLSGANLKFANLSRATLYCCEMIGVDARCANFANADMRGVTLQGSNLSRSCLDKADFRAGRLLKATPTGNEAIVDRNSTAAGVDFSYCSLNGATFEGADLNRADFTGAVIIGTKFKGARMTGANFTGAILTDINLSEIDLPREELKGCILPPDDAVLSQRGAILFQLKSHQNWIESDGRLGTSAVLDGFDLRTVARVIGQFKLTALSARKTIAAGIDFSCTELQGGNFEGADLRGASFEGADLRGARFHGALLHHARFLGADMRSLTLKTGEVLPCDLSGTDFTAAQRAEAVFA
jgi:uncharacterized protein YjbI with pentapeptide repeats